MRNLKCPLGHVLVSYCSCKIITKFVAQTIKMYYLKFRRLEDNNASRWVESIVWTGPCFLWGSSRESISLPFSTSWGCPHSLAHGPSSSCVFRTRRVGHFLFTWQPLWFSLLCLTLLLLQSSEITPAPTRIIQDNLPILGQLISNSNSIYILCHFPLSYNLNHSYIPELQDT